MSKVKRTRSQNAFTLIELLVVIAIIAILAAILFPVFAQAKEAAKKITCLSHVKELNAAFIMYANDYDDTWMSTGKQNFTVTSQAELNQFGGNKYDIFYLAQPYVKNYDIFFCPDRHVITTSTVDGFGGNSNRADNELFGYGMNYGPMHNRAGFGLVHASTKYMPSSPYYNKAHFFQGRSFSEFVNPAGLTTIQDTGDSPQYTNSPYDMCHSVARLQHARQKSFATTDSGAMALLMVTLTEFSRVRIRLQTMAMVSRSCPLSCKISSTTATTHRQLPSSHQPKSPASMDLEFMSPLITAKTPPPNWSEIALLFLTNEKNETCENRLSDV